MTEPIILNLKGFVQRTKKTNQLKLLFKSSGATLTRKGRSRNWQVSVKPEQMIRISQEIELACEPSWLWISKQISDRKLNFSFEELLRIAKENLPVTVTSLVSMTDCTISEARKAIDYLEWDSTL